jgi:hypothetical protein
LALTACALLLRQVFVDLRQALECLTLTGLGLARIAALQRFGGILHRAGGLADALRQRRGFAASLEDARQIGFDDAFQYEDFALPWSERRIQVTPGFERDLGLEAFQAWTSKPDRHPY